MMDDTQRVIGQLEGQMKTLTETLTVHSAKLDHVAVELAEHRGAAKRSTLIGSLIGALSGVLGIKLMGH